MTIQADALAKGVVEPALTQLANNGEPGSEGPIEVICRLHGGPLYRFLLRITFGDRRETEDLLQETLLRAWRYLQDHHADVTRLRPWLYTVARRVAIDAARARQARPTEVIVTDLGTLPAARDDIEQLLVVLTMRRGLMSLTQDHRQVLFEVFYNGSSAREAAETLGIPEGTVKSRMFYALRALGAVTGVVGAAQDHATLITSARRQSRTPGRPSPGSGHGSAAASEASSRDRPAVSPVLSSSCRSSASLACDPTPAQGRYLD